MEALRVQRAGYGGHAGLPTRTDPPAGGAFKFLTFDGGARLSHPARSCFRGQPESPREPSATPAVPLCWIRQANDCPVFAVRSAGVFGKESVPGLIVVPHWKSVPMEALRVQRAGYGGHVGLRTRSDSPVGGASTFLTFDGGAQPAAPVPFAAFRPVPKLGIGAGLNCRTPL